MPLRPVRPLDFRDAQIACPLAALVALLPPLWALEDHPDPLPNLTAALGLDAGLSGAIPLAVGYISPLMLLFVLRRTHRRWQRALSFLAGVFVGLIPFLFYWALESQWSSPAPLVSLALRGLPGGTVLGAIAAWYVPRSVQRRFKDRIT